MSHAAILWAVAISAMVGVMAGYCVGRATGEQVGRDREWMESFFRSIDNDRKRRDTNGRFKKKTN